MMTAAATHRAVAYVNAFTDIVLALGWSRAGIVQWWLCKPDGDQ